MSIVGRTITAVRPVSDAERRLFAWGTGAWGEQAVALELDDGSTIYPLSDAEGNGPGSLLVTAADGYSYSTVTA